MLCLLFKYKCVCVFLGAREIDLIRLDWNRAKGVRSPHSHVRTRLYFTSESHIYSLVNVLRYCQFGEYK